MAGPSVTNVSDMTSPARGFCLLSLDGGGIRGLSELIVIEELMERIKSQKKLDKPPKPAEVFDLIGGTSTGGLIAILLGRLRLSAADAILHYEALAKVVFSQKKAKGKDGTFKASKLKEAIEEVLEKTLGHERTNAKMYEEEITNSKECRAFVCAVGASDVTHPAGPTLFRTYDVAKNKEYNCQIWEAARATSAAPTFFKRIKIGPPGSGINYVDAGLKGCNNPIKQVIAEAVRVFGGEASVACIVSIGSGRGENVGLAQPDAFQKWLPTDLIRVMKEIVTDTGMTHEEMELRFKNMPGLYNRLDVDRGLHSVSLAEWKELGRVREHTKNYMKLEAIDRRVDHVVSALCGLCHGQSCKAGDLVSSARSKAHTFLRINIPQKRVSHFVTRHMLLADITARLFNADFMNTVVLIGMGGAGKTELALEVCRQTEEDNRFGAIFWIDASSPRSVMQCYKMIAQKILKYQQHNLDTGDNLCPEVQDALQHWDRQWLMVFDNYDNPKAFEGHSIRSFIPSGKCGRILFTSRLRDTARLGYQIDVSSMTEDESLKLLLQRPHSHRNGNEYAQGRKIVSTLGYLALALDQAGAYIRARSLDLGTFIQHYHDRRKIVLQEIPDEWEYSRVLDDEEKETRLRIFTTWELSFKQISGQEEELKNKEHFLTLAAFFNPGQISERYFRVYFENSEPSWMRIFSSSDRWDSYKLGDILSEFQKLSLLQTRNSTSGNQSITFHPVVCDWIIHRKSLDVQHKFAMELTTVLTDYLKRTEFDSLPLETRQETNRHLDSCLLSDKRISPVSDQILDSLPHSLAQFADFYCEQGRYNEAEDLFRRALAVREVKLGVAHSDTLATMAGLANVCLMQYQYDEAEKLHKQIRSACNRMFGDTHSKRYLQGVGTLGLVHSRQGRLVEIEELLSRASSEEFRNRASSDAESSFIYLQTVLAIEARLYAAQNRQDKAERLFERGLIACKETLGDTHPFTLDSMKNLATLYNGQSRYDEGKKLVEETVFKCLDTVGVQHASTLGLSVALARSYRGLGRHEEEIAVYKRVLVWYEDKLGATHIDTLGVLDLAYCHQKLGQHEEAIRLYKRALAECLENLGITHRYTMRAVENLAKCHRDLGQYEEVEELEKRFSHSHLVAVAP